MFYIISASDVTIKTSTVMKTISRIILSASALLALTSCDAMWDTSVDVPLGYGGSLGIGVSTPVYSPWSGYWPGSYWNGWNSGWWPGPSYIPSVRPPLRPGAVVNRPAVRPGNGVLPPPGWRPPVNTNPGPALPPAQKPIQPRSR